MSPPDCCLSSVTKSARPSLTTAVCAHPLFGWRRGHHELLYAVDEAREWLDVTGWPEFGPVVVGAASEEHSVLRGDDTPEVIPHYVIDVGYELPRLLGHAIKRQQFVGNHSAHRTMSSLRAKSTQIDSAHCRNSSATTAEKRTGSSESAATFRARKSAPVSTATSSRNCPKARRRRRLARRRLSEPQSAREHQADVEAAQDRSRHEALSARSCSRRGCGSRAGPGNVPAPRHKRASGACRLAASGPVDAEVSASSVARPHAAAIGPVNGLPRFVPSSREAHRVAGERLNARLPGFLGMMLGSTTRWVGEDEAEFGG